MHNFGQFFQSLVGQLASKDSSASGKRRAGGMQSR